jgi:hypothetical protein
LPLHPDQWLVNRRRYLAVVGAVASGLSGCAATGARREDASDTTPRLARTADQRRDSRRVDDVTLPVPRTELYPALPRDYIPALRDPAFADDWSGLSLPDDSAGETTRLPGDAAVIGVERGGEARAYPLRVLDWHEVVNDSFHGPLLVTYCVQCGSAVVVERVVRGTPTRFGVSGLLWRADLVLYDRATGSLWSQLLARAIDGPATGDALDVLPASLTTWNAWRADHPATTVLLPPPHSGTVGGYGDRRFDYFAPRYSYDEGVLVGYERNGSELHPQELVVGVEHEGVARAYTFRALAREDVVHDTVGGRPVVVAAAPGGTLVAYDRRVSGVTLRFESDGDVFLRGGGSRWRRTTGVAVDGPHAGTRLARANEFPPMFWLGWSEFTPETTVYGRDVWE